MVRARVYDYEKIHALRAEGVPVTKIAEMVGTSAGSIYRVLKGKPEAPKRTRPTNGRWSLERNPKPFNRAKDSGEKVSRNPIYVDRDPCHRCGARDRSLCGH